MSYACNILSYTESEERIIENHTSIMKQNCLSGFQQRKIKKAREQSVRSLSGSVLKYATPSTSKTITEKPEELSDSEDYVKDTSLTEGFVENLNRDEKMADDNPNSKSEGSETDKEGTDTNIHQEEEELDSESDKEKESDELITEMLRHSDVSLWPIPVPNDLRVDIIKRGSKTFQNKLGSFSAIHRQGIKSKGES